MELRNIPNAKINLGNRKIYRICQVSDSDFGLFRNKHPLIIFLIASAPRPGMQRGPRCSAMSSNGRHYKCPRFTLSGRASLYVA